MVATFIPDQTLPPCAHCGYSSLWKGLVGPDGKPSSGGVYVCSECCKVNVLELSLNPGRGRRAEQTLRKPTEDELRTFRMDPILRRRINMDILNAEAANYLRRATEIRQARVRTTRWFRR